MEAQILKKIASEFSFEAYELSLISKSESLLTQILNLYNYLEDSEKTSIRQICLGGEHTLCLSFTGKVYSFGWNNYSQCSKENDYDIDLDNIDEEFIQKNLYQDLPPVDLMIRTSGELRISNFMLYSLSYAELYFTNTCFPDFDEHEFDLAIEEYQNRHITKGKI